MSHNYCTSIPVFSGGRKIGQVHSGIFFKPIRGSRHFLRKPLAICFDYDVLCQAEQAGAVRVQCCDLETGTTYTATMRQLAEHGLKINRGFGDQVALPLSAWQVRKRAGGGQLQLPALEG